MKRLTKLLRVARFDFVESLRSRKAVALLLLYLTGALGSTAMFIRFVNAIEDALADTLVVARTEKVGTMTTSLFESEQFRGAVARLIGDRAVAESMLDLPPLALFYGAVALALVPLLTVLTSSDSVAHEVSTGASRFALFHVDRLSFALGKFAGQALLMTFGIVVGALGCYALGAYYLASFDYLGTASWLLVLCGRVWFYGLCFLGVAMGASLLSRSVNWARTLGLLGWFALVAVGGFLDGDWARARWPSGAPALLQLFPGGHRVDLWRPELFDRLPAMIMLTALSAIYFTLGYLRFARRDG
jgi:ABC-type transport system involved in multi-copper enzyme maturation permease subunit